MCRIADISWGGCFIQTPAQPGVAERTDVTAVIDGRELTLSGTVIYREPAVGFSMQFDKLTADQVEILTGLLGEPPGGTV